MINNVHCIICNLYDIPPNFAARKTNNNMIKNSLLFCVLSIVHLGSWAADIMPIDTLTMSIYYQQGISRLDSTYQNNQDRLDSLVGILHRLSSDSTFCLNSFSIVSGASPEGNTSLNKILSKNRSQSVSDYFRRRVPAQLASIITESHVGIDWDCLLIKVMHSGMPYKEEVAHILKYTPEWVVKAGVVVDSRKRQLMNLHGGICWHYMEEHFFPGLRRTLVEVRYSALPQIPEPELDSGFEALDIPQNIPLDSMTEMKSEDSLIILKPQLQSLSPFYMAVKTNLLYDALLVPNIGVEFYVGKGFSVGGNWMYAWWSSNSRHRYWRIYGGELAVRKYFNRTTEGSPLHGHHIGIYGQMFTYDFETGGRGYMGGRPGGTLWEKMNYSTGLEYGYSLPIAKKLNLDFVIGLGYWGGNYYEYVPIDNHYVWQATKKRNWFGPTKAEISLVWLLGRGNYNSKKGGER